MVQGVQEGEIFPLELIPENPDGDKKLCGRLPDPVVRGKPSAGDDAVHVDMVVQLLIPGVEYLDDPGLCAKIFLVCTQFQKGFGTALMEQSVKELLITVDQGIEFMGESKHHVEVRGINDFRPAFIHPDFFQYSLTDGAVPVPAGILVEFHVSAFAALTDIESKPAGLTCQDGAGSFFLFF